MRETMDLGRTRGVANKSRRTGLAFQWPFVLVYCRYEGVPESTNMATVSLTFMLYYTFMNAAS